MGREDKKEDFLSNLGRATMRGLRKCQKCGTLNGTRGYSCINASCDVVFKDHVTRKQPHTEGCKIISGSSAEIYSVRVRDRGPDYRGFAQLSIVHRNGNLVSNNAVPEDLQIQSETKCYVESCKSNYKYQNHLPRCAHIKAALICSRHAAPLILKQSVLNCLPIPSDLKNEMLELATDTSGPLVQRVSKSTMVVKCKPSVTHPLGFLHFNFNQSKSKGGKNYRFFCGCRAKFINPRVDSFRRCVHLYACLVAFASDEGLSSEFQYYIRAMKSDYLPKEILTNLKRGNQDDDDDEEDEDEDEMDEEEEDLKVSVGEEDSFAHCTIEATDEGNKVSNDHGDTSLEDVSERSFLILNDSDTGAPCQVEVEVLRDGQDLLDLPIEETHHIVPEDDIDSKLEIQLHTEDGIHLQTTDGETISVHQLPDNISLPSLKRKQDDCSSQDTFSPLVSKASARKSDAKKSSSIYSRKGCHVSELEVNFSFISWLESVKEKINQTMHYGFPGKPDPLIFHIPKSFFWCLLERINITSNSKKRRVHHESQTLIRKDAIPLGKFTKFTWKLLSVEQIQQVFTCDGNPLETTQYFLRQRDSTYKPSQMPQPPPDDPLARQGGTPIRPYECKTVLRVGQSSLLSKEPVPFVIEWIPDILPQSQIGELWIKFEFDHYCNGQLVLKQTPLILAKPTIKSANRTFGPPLAPRPPPNKVPLPVTRNDNVQISFPISTDSIAPNEGITILTF